MFEFSVSKHMKRRRSKSDNMRIPTFILTYLLTLIVKELKISVEQGRVVRASSVGGLGLPLTALAGIRYLELEPTHSVPGPLSTGSRHNYSRSRQILRLCREKLSSRYPPATLVAEATMAQCTAGQPRKGNRMLAKEERLSAN